MPEVLYEHSNDQRTITVTRKDVHDPSDRLLVFKVAGDVNVEFNIPTRTLREILAKQDTIPFGTY